MPEYPNAHPGAPLTVWLRPNPHDRGYQAVLGPAPDAVEYVRKDVCDAWLTEASRQPAVTQWPPLREVLCAAICALEDNEADGAERILRTALGKLPEEPSK